MTEKPLIRAARALALSDSGVDCWDALDPAMQAKLIESVRAVLGAAKYEDADEPTLIRVSMAHKLDAGTLAEAYDDMLEAATE